MQNCRYYFEFIAYNLQCTQFAQMMRTCLGRLNYVATAYHLEQFHLIYNT